MTQPEILPNIDIVSLVVGNRQCALSIVWDKDAPPLSRKDIHHAVDDLLRDFYKKERADDSGRS